MFARTGYRQLPPFLKPPSQLKVTFKHMSTISPQVLDEFWEVCNSTYKAWLARRGLFEDNPDIEALLATHCGPLLDHLNEVTHLHLLGQIVKLHDPPVQSGHKNLSIASVFEAANWDKEPR